MNVLLIGSGAREHAIAWKLRQSPLLSELHAAPGNPGIGELATLHALSIPRPGSPKHEIDAFLAAAVAVARSVDAGLVVVAPDDPLAFGLVDALESAGMAAFGPTAAAAEIEASKSFAKGLMERQHIPFGACATFTDFDEARRYVESRDGNVVVKADGPALGKGAIVTDSHDEAIDALRSLMLEGSLGASGATVVIEDRLTGPETSAHAFSDGTTVAHMPFACDHKAIFDGGSGPNTGGMGAYSPPSWLHERDAETIRSTVTESAIQGMAAEGRVFKGVLFPGILMTAAGPSVLEFNCRFGDPETEVLMPRLESDLLEIMLACTSGTLGRVDVRWRDEAAVTVMLASGGYPGPYETGKVITGLDRLDDDVLVFHAGTTRDDAGRLVTNGGRVLAVTALGLTVAEARAKVYANIRRISFEGMYYRKDIGVGEAVAAR